MNETYTQVGSDPSWIVAFMPVPAVIVYYFKSRKSNVEPRRFGWLLLLVIWFFTTAIVGIPMEWIIAGACVGGAVATLFIKSYGKGIVRYGLTAFFLVLAFTFTQIVRIGYTRIVLQDSQVKFAWIGRNDTVPRKGLRINYIGPYKDLWNIRAWTSWTSFSGKGRSEVLGPNIAGFFYYWGPHGLIRGDALAERLAKWANVVPTRSRSD